MKKFTLILLVVIGCTQSPQTAQDIIDQAISASGVESLRNAEASFTFRNINYSYSMKAGSYVYTRTQYDSAGNEIKDILNNEGLFRYLNDSLSSLDDEKRSAYTSSVNSVIYFAFLPLWLNDVAVNKTKLGEVIIDQKSYYKIKVTFDAQGGGEDFEDVFVYWFDTEDYSMDYLAYSYNEEEGKGMRFRVAYNAREVNNVIIQDYKNLKPKDQEGTELERIDEAYKNGKLEQLSLIELEDVVISTQ